MSKKQIILAVMAEHPPMNLDELFNKTTEKTAHSKNNLQTYMATLKNSGLVVQNGGGRYALTDDGEDWVKENIPATERTRIPAPDDEIKISGPERNEITVPDDAEEIIRESVDDAQRIFQIAQRYIDAAAMDGKKVDPVVLMIEIRDRAQSLVFGELPG